MVLEPEVLGLHGVRERDDDVVGLLHAPDDLAGPERRAAQARQELDLLERLGDEVIGAGVERGDHVLSRSCGR